jgi:hypothetical protein
VVAYFLALQGLQGAQPFLALQGLQAAFALQGLQAPQAAFALQGLQALHAASWIVDGASAAETAVGSATTEAARAATLSVVTVFLSMEAS